MAVIRTEKLTKKYHLGMRQRTVVAVQNLDLEVGEGEIFGLLGPNGSGKTTTLKLLLGLIRPSSGNAWVLGKSAGNNVEVRRKIGYMPDGPYFYEYLTAGEFLDFSGRLFGMAEGERRRRTDELLDFAGLAENRRMQLGHFSRGMLQRIGLAQMLINDPVLLFMDEPTTGLDPIGAAEIREVIIRLKDEGKTIFICSHLLSEAESICDRVGIIHRGKLIVDGRVDSLLGGKEEMELIASGVADSEVESIRSLGTEVRKEDRKLIISFDDKALSFEILEMVKKGGGEVISLGHPKRSLETLFVQAVNSSK